MTNSNLKDRVNALLDSKQITQAELAKRIGYTSAAISTYKRGAYAADESAIEQALTEFFAVWDAREDLQTEALTYGRRDSYIPIASSEATYRLIKYAQIERKLVVIYGDTGVGKTKAAYKFADDNPASTVYIASSPSCRSLRATLKQLARELRLPVRQTADMATAIREKMQNEGKTLIIDEAQFLTVSVVDEISRWVDPDPVTGDPRMAIALIGNDGVLEKFDGRKDERRNQNRGRMCLPLELRSAKTTADDVRKLFPALTERGETKELELLLAVSRGVTGIRAAVEIYNSAINAGKIDYDTMLGFARSKQALAV